MTDVHIVKMGALLTQRVKTRYCVRCVNVSAIFDATIHFFHPDWSTEWTENINNASEWAFTVLTKVFPLQIHKKIFIKPIN